MCLKHNLSEISISKDKKTIKAKKLYLDLKMHNRLQ